MTSPSAEIAALLGGELGSAQNSATAWGWGLYDGMDLTPRPRRSQVDQAIRSDGRTSLLEQALTLPLRGASYHLVKPDRDIGQTAWVEQHLLTPANAGGMSTPFDTVIGQMTAATWQRFVAFEKVWAACDGGTRVGYDSLAIRPGADQLRDLRSGKFRGISQIVPKVEDGKMVGTETITLPPERCFVYVHGQHRDPLHGVGDLDVAWLAAEVKKKLRFLWWKFLENVSFPSATITTTAPAGDAATLNAAAQRAASLRSGGVLPLAQGEELKPYDSNGAGAAQFMAALDWLSAEQAQSVLAGFADLTSLSKAGGSYALSTSQTDLFTGGRDTVLREMATTLNAYVLADLVRYNYGPGVEPPKLVFTPLRQTDLQNITDLLKAMARESADSTIPQSFIDELAIKTAGYLELDVEKVRDDLASGHPIGAGAAAVDPVTGRPIVAPKPAPAAAPVHPVAQVAGTVERARQLVLAHDAIRHA